MNILATGLVGQWERVRSRREEIVFLLTSAWLYVLVFAPLTGFTILFVALEDEFGASTTATGEIGSVAWAVFNLSTPLPTFLFGRWGPRAVAALGVLLCGSGLFVSTFARDIWPLFLFYGAIQGMGLCFIQLVILKLMTGYFSGSSLVRALSFAAMGETVGMFVISPIFAIGFTELGWRMVCQISAIVVVSLCLPACYVLNSGSTHSHIATGDAEAIKERRIGEKLAECNTEANGEKEAVTVKSFGQTIGVPGVWIFSMATVLYVLCMAFVMISLVEILVVQGGTMVDSAWFATIFAISQVVGKIINVVIGNRLPLSNMKVLVLTCLVGGLMSLGMVFWGTGRAYIVAYSIVNGLIRSNISSRNLPAAIEVFGKEASSVLINCMCISIGVAFLSASLVGGMSYDMTGSYHSAHVMITAFWILAALLLLPLAFLWPSCVFRPVRVCRQEYESVKCGSALDIVFPQRKTDHCIRPAIGNQSSECIHTDIDAGNANSKEEEDINKPLLVVGFSRETTL